MKYFVNTDSKGYVVSIQHTNSSLDFIELDLTKYDLTGLRKFAYKLGKDKLIFDEEHYKELLNKYNIEENEKEIASLKIKLTETDYIVSRAFEEVMALSNPLTWVADVIKIMVKYSSKYKDVIKNRSTWRKRIEELQNQNGGKKYGKK